MPIGAPTERTIERRRGERTAYFADMPLLVVIAGPIGAGKSTVADLLGHRLAASGLTAAVVDLDDVAFMQRDIAPQKIWRRGAIALTALVRGWFDAKTDAVIAHGPFFEAGGYDLLLRQPTDVVIRHVLLRVSYETALVRVTADPSRGASKNPEFLRSTHDRFRTHEASLPAPDFVFDTETVPAQQIANQVAQALTQ